MTLLKDIRTFVKARINRDSEDNVLQPNEYRSIKNMLVKNGRARNIKGTVQIDMPALGDGPYYAVACERDTENNAILFFLAYLGSEKEGSDVIARYYPETGEVKKILEHEYLNFQVSHPIEKINLLEGLAYWTDNYQTKEYPFLESNYNPPRKLNLLKAQNYTESGWCGHEVFYYSDTTDFEENTFLLYQKNIFRTKVEILYTTNLPPPPETASSNDYYEYIGTFNIHEHYLGITRRILDRIKYPPEYPPALSDREAGSNIGPGVLSFTNGVGDDGNMMINYVRNRYFQFRYRYIYDDNERSVWSGISDIVLPEGLNYLSEAQYVLDQTASNVVGIDINTGPFEVKAIEIAVREGNTGVWKRIEKIYKYEEDGTINTDYKSNDTITYCFYNNVAGEPLDQDETSRHYHDIPQISRCQELIEKNRLLDANYIKGFDNIKVDIDSQFLDSPLTLEAGAPESFYTTRHSMSGASPAGLNGKVQMFTPAEVVEGAYYYANIYIHYEYHSWPYYTSPEFLLHAGVTCRPGWTPNVMAEKLRTQIQQKLDSLGCDGPWSVTVPSWLPNHILVHWLHSWPVPLGGELTLAIINAVDYNMLTTWVVYPGFKSNTFYNVGIQYFDRAGRIGAVNIGENSKVHSPSFNSLHPNQEAFIKRILHCRIHHQPPEEATHYQMVLSHNSIAKFLQFAITPDQLVYDKSGFVDSEKIYLDIHESIKYARENIPGFNEKYWVFQKGDRVRFSHYAINANENEVFFPKELDFELMDIEYFDDAAHNYGYEVDDAINSAGSHDYITDEDGNKVKDISTSRLVLPRFNKENYIQDAYNHIVVEVYRPHREITDDENMMFFEFGDKLPIHDPHTANRRHGGNYQSQSGGVPATNLYDKGDIYTKYRFTGTKYFTSETESFSDFRDSEVWGKGRVNIVDRNMRRQRFFANACFSGRYIQDTQINDLSDVRPEDYVVLPSRFGEITTMNEVGDILKLRQRSKSSSLYIGRTVLNQADGSDKDNQIVSSTRSVIGTLVKSKANWGCINPESSVVTPTYEYFVDVLNGVIIRDAPNGPFPISHYGMREYVKNLCQSLLNDCYTYKILGGYDDFNDFVYFTFIGFPETRGGELIVYDTLVFDEPGNSWIGILDMRKTPSQLMEKYTSINNRMFSFCQGQLYEHQKNDTYGLFYDTQHYPEISLVANANQGLIKNFQSLAIYSNKKWYAPEVGDISVPANENYPEMLSRVKNIDVKTMEGVCYVPLGKNMVTNSSIPSNLDLINGEELRGEVLYVKLTNEENGDVWIDKIVVNSLVSKKAGVYK